MPPLTTSRWGWQPQEVPKSFQIHISVASTRSLFYLASCTARNLIDVNCELSTWSNQSTTSQVSRAWARARVPVSIKGVSVLYCIGPDW